MCGEKCCDQTVGLHVWQVQTVTLTLMLVFTLTHTHYVVLNSAQIHWQCDYVYIQCTTPELENVYITPEQTDRFV